MNPVLTAAVRENTYGRFHAHLIVDGEFCGRDCMHNHHSRAAAEKCCAPLVARHVALFAAATLIQDIGDGLTEVTTRDDKGRTVTFRMRMGEVN